MVVAVGFSGLVSSILLQFCLPNMKSIERICFSGEFANLVSVSVSVALISDQRVLAMDLVFDLVIS